MTAYEKLVTEYGSIHRNKCIDGKVTGQSCCVGYCSYCEHSGFLTKALRKQHDCIKKGCHYYIPKQRTVKSFDEQHRLTTEIETQINESVSKFEGMKILRITETSNGIWKINYVTISNEYPLENISKEIEKKTDCKLIWNKVNCDYELCAKIVFA